MKFLVLVMLFAWPASAQQFSQSGYLETRLFGYPQEAKFDRALAVGEAQFHWEASWRMTPVVRLFGAVDANAVTHREASRKLEDGWSDRGLQRPLLSASRLGVAFRFDRFSVVAGKQLIRWGRTDLLSPVDRFAPRDYINVADDQLLAVQAVRLTERGSSHELDLVYAPRFTPSRAPLPGQRWVVLPGDVDPEIRFNDRGAGYPGGPQFGARFTHYLPRFEYSLTFYEGFQNLPVVGGGYNPFTKAINYLRVYPKLRMAGADTAIPLDWLTLKAEAAYFASPNGDNDDYGQAVIQVERNAGEWFLTGGYAGEHVFKQVRPYRFAPDRGLTRAFLGHARRQLDERRNLELTAVVRSSGQGMLFRAAYSHNLSAHFSLTLSWTFLHGKEGDFLGNYSRNSQGGAWFRYGF